MDFQGLMDLREQVEGALVSQLVPPSKGNWQALGGSIASLGEAIARGGRGSTLKGKKVPPKYRSPDGETWAGRGATPRWLKAAIKDGKKLETFLIEKTGVKVKKRKSKG